MSAIAKQLVRGPIEGSANDVFQRCWRSGNLWRGGAQPRKHPVHAATPAYDLATLREVAQLSVKCTPFIATPPQRQYRLRLGAQASETATSPRLEPCAVHATLPHHNPEQP